MKVAPALALFFVLSQGSAYAQYGETVEVRVTNVDAIVTDKNGNPVPGLTKDDFEVYEDGVRKDITHFAEIAETRGQVAQTRRQDGTPAAASPEPEQADSRRRLITVLVDHSSLEPANRAAVLPKLQEFLITNIRPGDAAAIYSWDEEKLTVELQPTSDPAAIASAIARIAAFTPKRPGWRYELQRELDAVLYDTNIMGDKRPFFDEGMKVTRKAAERGVAEMRQKAEVMKSILATLRREEGRKVLVLLTQSLSTNPAEEAFYYFYTLRSQFIEGSTLRWALEARKYAVPELAKEIAAAAINAGVTLYPLHTAGKFTEVTDTEAQKGGTYVNVFMQPPRLLRTTVSEGDPRLLTLSAASDETGGRAIAGSGNWENAFNAVSTELNAYYSIGYSAGGEREDRIREIEVRPRNKAYRVRTRRSLVEQSAASAMKEMVAANLFQTAATNDLGVTAGIAGTATPAGENLVHPVTITIPTSSLTLTPDGTDLAGKFLVFAAFHRADGAVSAVGPQVQQFRFPAASLAKRKQVTVKLDVTADARVTAISVGVMDDASNATGFALVKLPEGPAE